LIQESIHINTNESQISVYTVRLTLKVIF